MKYFISFTFWDTEKNEQSYGNAKYKTKFGRIKWVHIKHFEEWVQKNYIARDVFVTSVHRLSPWWWPF